MTTVARATVVVGVDGSKRSLAAVEVAAVEAARRSRPLHIVSVFSWPGLPVVLPPGLIETTPQGICKGIQAGLVEARCIAAQAAPGVSITTELIMGRPAPVLLELSSHADLVVVGERGIGGLLLGSVASHVATHAACPVLVARGEPKSSGPVLVGVDGSPCSAEALEVAFEEAAMRGTRLVALHAWTGADRTELNGEQPERRDYYFGLSEEERVLAEAMAGASARFPDVPVRRRVVRGHAGPLLSEFSRVAQLVIVGPGAHPDSGSGLGSVSRHLIFHAGCPAMVVRSRSRVG